MDTARQVLRYSIPGSVTMMLLAGFVVLGRLLLGDSFAEIGDSVGGEVSAIVVIFATIPLGFVIYQLYYDSYQSMVRPWRPRPFAGGVRWVRVDRGARVLSSLPAEQQRRIEGLFDVELELEWILRLEQTRLGELAHAYRLGDEFIAANEDDPYEAYRLRRQKHSNVLRSLVGIGDGVELGNTIKSEYTTLSDIYHALGACRTGVQLAGLGSLIIILLSVMFEWPGFWCGLLAVGVTSIVTGAVTAALLWVFHQTRRNSWNSAEVFLQLSLTALFKRHPELLEAKP